MAGCSRPRSADIRPGTVGYVDNGRCHRIADLANADELRQKGGSGAFVLPVADSGPPVHAFAGGRQAAAAHLASSGLSPKHLLIIAGG
ncbi:hypothetical protein PG994_008529 [Apiospora phragmitis]|uniref:Uncharacterized protein n=1 Tax=Apiospora phragmitis TaxID=2905665 RepID=A0ABR1UGQ5_9PEZI